MARFDGGDVLGLNDFGWAGGNSYTMLAVVAPPATGDTLTAFAALDGDDPALLLEFQPTEGLVGAHHRWPAAATGGDVAVAELAGGGAQLVSVRRSGPAMSVTAEATASITGSEDDIDAAGLDLRLGAETHSSPTAGYVGDIAEIAFVNDVLSNDEEQALTEWLRSKWGL